MRASGFFESTVADRVSSPEELRDLLLILEGESELLYDITFYARFAQRMFSVMQREGKDAEGFDRMQQSFQDAVGRVRDTVRSLETRGFAAGARYTQVESGSFQALMLLIGDLSLVKDWMLDHSEAGGAFNTENQHNSDSFGREKQ